MVPRQRPSGGAGSLLAATGLLALCLARCLARPTQVQLSPSEEEENAVLVFWCASVAAIPVAISRDLLGM